MNYKTSTGYTQEFRSQHEARLAEQEQQREQFRRENEMHRQKRLALLEDEREAKRKEDEAEVERELAPDKERTQREWLANHPGKTVADFERHAWPQLRLNIIAQKQAESFEQTKASMRASGRYGL